MRINHLEGQRFGKLVVIEDLGIYKHKRHWKCQCDCGNTKVTTTTLLNKGKVKSCGCYKGNHSHKGFITKAPGEVGLHVLYIQYRISAKKRNIYFHISKDNFKLLTSSNCYYCGRKPSYIKRAKNDNSIYIYNGVDRVDTNKGYIISNCVPCCHTCNAKKAGVTLEIAKRMVEWCNYEHTA